MYEVRQGTASTLVYPLIIAINNNERARCVDKNRSIRTQNRPMGDFLLLWKTNLVEKYLVREIKYVSNELVVHTDPI